MSDYSGGGDDYDEKDEYFDGVNYGDSGDEEEIEDEEIEDDEIDDDNEEDEDEEDDKNDYGSENENSGENEVDDFGMDIPMETGEKDIFEPKIRFEKDKLLQKIMRYMKQGKFTDTDYRYMVHLCRNENDYMTETKTGIHLKFGQYSDETLLAIKEFVEQSEANWKEAEKEALTQQENRKKNRDNETIDFFKKRTDEREEQNEKMHVIKTAAIPTVSAAGNEINFLNLGVDNKKKPLNEYKGIYQRIMRKSRAIKNHKSIPNKKKKRTTEILNGNNEEENVYDESIPVEEMEDKVDDNEEDIDNEDNEDDENEEEKEDEDSDEEDDDEEEDEDDISSLSSSEDSDDYKDSDDDSSNEEEGDRAELDELGKKYK